MFMAVLIFGLGNRNHRDATGRPLQKFDDETSEATLRDEQATPRIEAPLLGARYVDDYCTLLGYFWLGRMPIRRRTSRKA
jgi:hypothetical protein